jgi:hypothetical protein
VPADGVIVDDEDGLFEGHEVSEVNTPWPGGTTTSLLVLRSAEVRVYTAA